MGTDFEYHKDPEKTEAAHLEPGVFTIGDVGYVDADGYLFLSDRKIDMIISGGVNIYPAEIEGVLCDHPAVLDAAVFGIPDEEFGEEVKAAVELAPGHTRRTRRSSGELVAYCRERLAGYKAPRSIDFVDALPRHPTGKLYKRLLRDPYWQGHAGAASDEESGMSKTTRNSRAASRRSSAACAPSRTSTRSGRLKARYGQLVDARYDRKGPKGAAELEALARQIADALQRGRGLGRRRRPRRVPRPRGDPPALPAADAALLLALLREAAPRGGRRPRARQLGHPRALHRDRRHADVDGRRRGRPLRARGRALAARVDEAARRVHGAAREGVVAHALRAREG